MSEFCTTTEYTAKNGRVLTIMHIAPVPNRLKYDVQTIVGIARRITEFDQENGGIDSIEELS